MLCMFSADMVIFRWFENWCWNLLYSKVHPRLCAHTLMYVYSAGWFLLRVVCSITAVFPARFQDSTWNTPRQISSKILPNSLFASHPNFRRYIIYVLTSILKMETASSSEMFTSTYKTIWCHNPEYQNMKTGNGLEMYPEDVRFASRPGHWLFLLRFVVVFLSPLRQILG
jgi:hypothetical protein